MSLRYVLGKQANCLTENMLASPVFPLARAVPWSRYVWYDLQRIRRSRQAKMIFDVGANTGQTITGLRRYFPKAQIHSFEPAPKTFDRLRQNTARWPRVTPHQLALGRTAETRQMRVGEGAGASEWSTFRTDSVHDVPMTTEMVQIDSLDSFCRKNGVEHIDILKLDVQGWELEVLAGASEMLAAGKIDHIFCEVGLTPGDCADTILLTEVAAHCKTYDFMFSGLYDQYRWGRKSHVYFGNALFSHRRFEG